jgi:alpha-tubulin suppressor-like RCC1 family protein
LYGKLGRKGSGAENGSVYYRVTALQGKRVTNVDCGNCHTAVCTDEGEVYTFGGGGKFYNRGQLGVHDMEDSLLPRRIESFGSRIFIRSVCCGGYHTLALSAACHVYSWGRGDFGQLGLGHENNETEPRLIESLVKIGSIVALDAGENHSIACAETGMNNNYFCFILSSTI